MDTQTSVQLFALVHLTTMGLSHILAHRGWAEFFILLREKGTAGVFVVGFLSLGFGSVVVAFHPVWSGPAIVLTLFGWAQVLKGLLYFSIPAYGRRKLGLVSIDRSRLFMIPGAGLLVIAGFLLWIVLTG